MDEGDDLTRHEHAATDLSADKCVIASLQAVLAKSRPELPPPTVYVVRETENS